MTKQEQVNAAMALLFVQEAVEDGLFSMPGSIDRAKCQQTIDDLAKEGFTPDEDVALRTAAGFLRYVGGSLVS